MKTILYPLALALCIGFNACKPGSTAEPEIGRVNENFNHDWEFTIANENKTRWDWVDLPHTPKIEPLVVNNQWQGTMWYKKRFTPTNHHKKYFLNFEGLMQDAELWINDVAVGTHHGGYLPFNIEISQYLTFNHENEIKLKLSNTDNLTIPPGKTLKTLDFNTYGGIYRDVNLTQTNAIYISDAIIENKAASGGILVHFSEVSSNQAKASVKVHVNNQSENTSNIHCQIKLISPKGNESMANSPAIKINANADASFITELNIADPELWSITQPNLYKLKVSVYAGQTLMDEQIINTGIRSIKLTKNGFYLNGEKIFMRGTNRHQEYPYLGYALSNNANYRDAVKIKEAGFDFVRLSHYPQDNSFLDACDELGILVMNAIPGWQYIGDSTFIENSYQNIRDMVKRDRNHPSIILWENSLNESQMTDEYIVKANAILKEELPFEDTYSAGWMDHEAYDLFIPARQHGKPPYYWNDYKNNERPVFIAEYGDWEYYAQNAGFNQTSFSNLKDDDRSSRHLRGAGEQRLLQQALNFQEAANSNRKGKSTIGHANWLMFDYNRGYSNDIEASGIADIFRIPKFAFYFYKSQRPIGENTMGKANEPFVFIANHMLNEKNVTIYSNCDEVELFSNNKLVGSQKPSVNQYADNLAQAPFVFNKVNLKDSLTAIGKVKGKVLTRTTIYKAGKAQSIVLNADLSGKALASHCNDIVFIYAQVVDQNGQVLPDFNKELQFKIDGPATIIGGQNIKAEAGIATILIKAGKTAGTITISALSEQNIAGELSLQSE